jgi:hypothetical protein
LSTGAGGGPGCTPWTSRAAKTRTGTLNRCEARRSRSKASSGPPPCWAIKMTLACSITGVAPGRSARLGAVGGKRCQRIVTGTGCEAIPFATTTRVLGPAGVVVGTVNWVDEAAPSAIETELQRLVRA